MASRRPSLLRLARRHIRCPFAPGVGGFAAFAVSLCVGVAACDRQPLAPASVRPLTVSGFVYERPIPGSGSGEPKLAGVLITVHEVDGSSRTATTDEIGFYTVGVRAGTISMTASKIGYTTGESMFEMANSTVLNFGLSRDAEPGGDDGSPLR